VIEGTIGKSQKYCREFRDISDQRSEIRKREGS
jgi:hypothetical protein